MDVTFAFDMEDFVTPEAAEAQLFWATELAQRGITGNFQVVAEVVRAHRRTGRDDVLQAVGRHCIGYHTDQHSIHPTHPEALDGVPLDEAVPWVIRREAAGVAEVAACFGRMPLAYVGPGGSWTAATLLGMASMGLKMWVGSSGAPRCWYCGLLTGQYDLFFDRYFDGDPAQQYDRFIHDAEPLLQQDESAGPVVFFSHPCRLVTSRFWDVAVFDGKSLDVDKVPPAPLRSNSQIEAIKSNVRRWLDRLADDPRVRFVDYPSYYNTHRGSARLLDELCREADIPADHPGLLPLKADHNDGGTGMAAWLDEHRYTWGVLPRSFTGEAVRKQNRGLAWTAAPIAVE